MAKTPKPPTKTPKTPPASTTFHVSANVSASSGVTRQIEADVTITDGTPPPPIQSVAIVAPAPGVVLTGDLVRVIAQTTQPASGVTLHVSGALEITIPMLGDPAAPLQWTRTISLRHAVDGPLALAVILDSWETSQTVSVTVDRPDPVPIPEGVFAAEQFEYLGSFRLPDDVIGYTEFGYGMVAGRKVNGQVRLFLTGSEPMEAPILEITDPGVYGFDYRTAPYAPTVTRYDVGYRAKRGTWRTVAGLSAQHDALAAFVQTLHGQQLVAALAVLRDLRLRLDALQGKPRETVIFEQFVPNKATNAGLWYDAAQDLCFLTYNDSYNTTGLPDWGLMAIRLNADGTSTPFGPWRTKCIDGDDRVWFGPWRTMYIAAHPENGGIICGATLQSGNAASPWGPDCYGEAPWPTPETPANYDAPDLLLPKRYLEHYYIGTEVNADGTMIPGKPIRAARRAFDPTVFDFYAGDPAQGIPADQVNGLDPAKHNGVGTWTDVDGTTSLHWIHAGTQRGVLFLGSVSGSPEQDPLNPASAHVWYMNVHKPICPSHGMTPPLQVTGPVATAKFPFLCCYDPADLEAVARGEIPDYAPEPIWFLNLETAFPGFRVAPISMSGAAKTISGGFFDPETRNFYLVAQRADDSSWGLTGALFHVLHIKEAA